jgi:hypothetical protein
MTMTDAPPEVIDCDLSVPCQCRLFPDNPCGNDLMVGLNDLMSGTGGGEMLCQACRPHCNVPPAQRPKLQGWCCQRNLARCRLVDGKHVEEYRQ